MTLYRIILLNKQISVLKHQALDIFREYDSYRSRPDHNYACLFNFHIHYLSVAPIDLQTVTIDQHRTNITCVHDQLYVTIYMWSKLDI